MRLLLGFAIFLIATMQSAMAENDGAYLQQLRTEAVALCSSRWPSRPLQQQDCMRKAYTGLLYYFDALKQTDGDAAYLVEACQKGARSENPDHGIDWAKTQDCIVKWEKMRDEMRGNPFYKVFEDSAINSVKTTNMLGELADIQQYIRAKAFKEKDGSYLKLSSELGSEIVNIWSGKDTFRHVFGGRIGLAPYDIGDGPGSGFLIQFEDVPGNACARLTALNLGKGLFLVAIGDVVRAASHGSAYFSEETAKSVCEENGNTISWVFR